MLSCPTKAQQVAESSLGTARVRNNWKIYCRCRANLEQISEPSPNSGLALIHLQYDILSTQISYFYPAHKRLVKNNYRGTSPIRTRRPLGPYSSLMPRAIWWS